MIFLHRSALVPVYMQWVWCTVLWIILRHTHTKYLRVDSFINNKIKHFLNVKTKQKKSYRKGMSVFGVSFQPVSCTVENTDASAGFWLSVVFVSADHKSSSVLKSDPRGGLSVAVQLRLSLF